MNEADKGRFAAKIKGSEHQADVGARLCEVLNVPFS